VTETDKLLWIFASAVFAAVLFYQLVGPLPVLAH
jgi:hypothetical protein